MYFVLLMIDVKRDKRDWVLYLDRLHYLLWIQDYHETTISCTSRHLRKPRRTQKTQGNCAPDEARTRKHDSGEMFDDGYIYDVSW